MYYFPTEFFDASFYEGVPVCPLVGHPLVGQCGTSAREEVNHVKMQALDHKGLEASRNSRRQFVKECAEYNVHVE